MSVEVDNQGSANAVKDAIQSDGPMTESSWFGLDVEGSG